MGAWSEPQTFAASKGVVCVGVVGTCLQVHAIAAHPAQVPLLSSGTLAVSGAAVCLGPLATVNSALAQHLFDQ